MRVSLSIRQNKLARVATVPEEKFEAVPHAGQLPPRRSGASALFWGCDWMHPQQRLPSRQIGGIMDDGRPHPPTIPNYSRDRNSRNARAFLEVAFVEWFHARLPIDRAGPGRSRNLPCLDDFGVRLGCAWPETDQARTDRQTLITNLIDGQYSQPVKVVAFNTAEGWSRDISEEIAVAVLERIVEEGRDLSPSLESFLDQHGGHLSSSSP